MTRFEIPSLCTASLLFVAACFAMTVAQAKAEMCEGPQG